MKTTRILISILVLSLSIFTVIIVKAQYPEIVSTLSSITRTSDDFTPLEDCPVTQPQEPPFTPPLLYPPDVPSEDQFWYGSDSLWTMLQVDGIWDWLPYYPEEGGHYFNKVVWWNEKYNWKKEPRPNLTVTAHRFDDPSVTYETSNATNAYEPTFGSVIMTGVEIPSPGCWEFTGQYGDVQLSFVVWVARQ